MFSVCTKENAVGGWRSVRDITFFKALWLPDVAKAQPGHSFFFFLHVTQTAHKGNEDVSTLHRSPSCVKIDS